MVLVYLVFERYGWLHEMRMSFALVSRPILSSRRSVKNLYEGNAHLLACSESDNYGSPQNLKQAVNIF
jgi:hypothetical protein